jgi:2-hydroxy-3-keto-5-methylthiopentenyl-1-phosphate phosphatase
MAVTPYRAVISSDWNECLAPCGPFDPITFTYPELTADLTALFKAYTGNRISLGKACAAIEALLPEPLSVEQMDAYLDASFETYAGVSRFIQWCKESHILFMINTTGLAGYFQRVFARRLLPPVHVLSSNAMLRYPRTGTDPQVMLDLHEIQDKGRNTERIMRQHAGPDLQCIIVGDSGGDGPHFEWGAGSGAFLIGLMPKPSLLEYCDKKGVTIDLLVGSNGPVSAMRMTSAIDSFLSGKGKSCCRHLQAT